MKYLIILLSFSSITTYGQTFVFSSVEDYKRATLRAALAPYMQVSIEKDTIINSNGMPSLPPPVNIDNSQAVMIPLEYNGQIGMWSNRIAVKDIAFKLNDERSCQLSRKYEVPELHRVKKDNTRLLAANTQGEAKINQLTDEIKQKDISFGQERNQWNKLLLEEKDKRIKTTFRLGIFSVSLALVTWVAGKLNIF
jgi:hypothetical protein